MENILEVCKLSKSFPGFSIREVSFELPRGYIMGFIGPNGAGKTTIIKLIMNLIKKDSGKVNIFGLDHSANEIEIKNRIGFVYDENHFYEELNVSEMSFIVSRFYKNWDEQVFKKYLDKFGIPLKQKIKKLSKGMKMKFSLAVALSHNAELLIMDEPTSGLDPLVRNDLMQIISELIQSEKKGVFFSTHITSDLDKIADYITFINNGEIIFSESKEKIFEKYRIVKGDKRILDPIRNRFVGLKENSYGFEGLILGTEDIGIENDDRCLIEKPTLDDIMLYTVRGIEKCLS